jgi:hypothetical protein
MARKIKLQAPAGASTAAYMPPSNPGMGAVGIIGWAGGIVAMLVCGVILYLNMSQQDSRDKIHAAKLADIARTEQDHIDQINQKMTEYRKQIEEDRRQTRPLETNVQTLERNLDRLKTGIATLESNAAPVESPDQGMLRRDLASAKAERSTLMRHSQSLDNQIMAMLAKWQPPDKPTDTGPVVANKTPEPETPVSILDPKSKINVNNLSLTFLTDKSKSRVGDDNYRQTLNMSVKATNKDTVRDLTGARMEVFAFAENLFEKDHWILLVKKSQPLDLAKRASAEFDMGQATMYYDKSGSVKWGYKYDGYMIFLFDANNELIKTETNRTQFSKLYDKLSKVAERHSFDKNGNDLGYYTYFEN